MTTSERGVVTQRHELMPGVWLLRLHSPHIATTAEPGQFVHVRCAEGSDPLLRRPFSICEVDRRGGTYDILFNVVGPGTAILAGAEAGQVFEALGPLGHAFSLPESGTLLMIAGGLGVAPFPFVWREAGARGLQLAWLNGAYTGHQLYPRAELPRGMDVHQCTDDGSAGERGFVTALSEKLVTRAAMVHACGPMPMLQALSRQLLALEAGGVKLPPCEMSLEAPMGCALGTCLGCVVPAADGSYARLCIEGAVMDWRAIDWNALASLGELVVHRREAERLSPGMAV